MKKSAVSLWLGLVLALGAIGSVVAEGPTTTQKGASLDVLKGTWVRPDGGYIIAIKSIGPGGEIGAMYFNPTPLPFAKAQALRDGATLRAFFELRAGGYGGSTYELAYDPGTDRLRGIYYQAVAKARMFDDSLFV